MKWVYLEVTWLLMGPSSGYTRGAELAGAPATFASVPCPPTLPAPCSFLHWVDRAQLCGHQV